MNPCCAWWQGTLNHCSQQWGDMYRSTTWRDSINYCRCEVSGRLSRKLVVNPGSLLRVHLNHPKMFVGKQALRSESTHTPLKGWVVDMTRIHPGECVIFKVVHRSTLPKGYPTCETDFPTPTPISFQVVTGWRYVKKWEVGRVPTDLMI